MIVNFFSKEKKGSKAILTAMVPKGLAAAVLVTFYVNNTYPSESLIGQRLVFLIYAVILITILISSVIVYIKEKQTKQ